MDELTEHILEIDKALLDAKAPAGSPSLVRAPKEFNGNLIALLIEHYDAWETIKIFKDSSSETFYLDFIEKPKKIRRKAKV